MIAPDLVVAACIVLVNRMLAPRVLRFAIAFWAIQALNIAGAAWFAIRGFDGLAHYPIAGWAVAVLYMLHFGRNLMARRAIAGP